MPPDRPFGLFSLIGLISLISLAAAAQTIWRVAQAIAAIALPFLWRESLHRQGVQPPAELLAEQAVHQLVAGYARQTLKVRAGHRQTEVALRPLRHAVHAALVVQLHINRLQSSLEFLPQKLLSIQTSLFHIGLHIDSGRQSK